MSSLIIKYLKLEEKITLLERKLKHTSWWRFKKIKNLIKEINETKKQAEELWKEVSRM